VGIVPKLFTAELSALRVSQRPRHSEVDQERTTRRKPNNQILAATIDLGDTLALELAGDLERVVWTREARVGDLDVLEAVTLERRREPAADGLDLGQLGHGPHRTERTWLAGPGCRTP
jgi:hypothetical protein